jgi:lipopolysaccharide transport system ATP-binding protein
MEPDVLIIDEVLAVGDAGFRAKCFNRMSELSSKAVLIFVSHSMPLIGRVCSRGLLMERGVVKIDNNINDVIFEYMTMQNSGIKGVVGDYVLDYFNAELSKKEINYFDDLNVKLVFKMNEKIKLFFIHYTILDQEQKAVYQSFSLVDNEIIINTNEIMEISFCIKNIDLTNGKYFLNIGFIENGIRGKNICRYDSVAEFLVKGGKFNSFASIVKKTKWNLKKIV